MVRALSKPMTGEPKTWSAFHLFQCSLIWVLVWFLQTVALEKQIEFQKRRMEQLQTDKNAALESMQEVDHILKQQVLLALTIVELHEG